MGIIGFTLNTQSVIFQSRNLYSKALTFKKRSKSSNNGNLTNAKVDYQKRVIDADNKNFVNINVDLINFISNNKELTGILQQTKSINGRNDLKEIVISGALEKLDGNSPVSKKFLEEHIDFAKFIAANLGKITDIFNDDRELAKVIVEKGDVVGNSILSSVADKVSSILGDSSIITEEFLNDHPVAAIHLLMHPSTLSRIRTDPSEARTFITELSRNTPSYNSDIAGKAKELLNMPHVFTTEFLENETKFSQIVVASSLNDDALKLPDYIQNNADLTLDDFTTSELIQYYQIALAMSKFPDDFALDEKFFSENKSITSAVILSEEFAANVKKDSSKLEKFFGSGRFTVNYSENFMKTITGIYNSPFQSHELKAFSVDLYA